MLFFGEKHIMKKTVNGVSYNTDESKLVFTLHYTTDATGAEKKRANTVHTKYTKPNTIKLYFTKAHTILYYSVVDMMPDLQVMDYDECMEMLGELYNNSDITINEIVQTVNALDFTKK